jgi:multimeric flavodoxin WrbA
MYDSREDTIDHKQKVVYFIDKLIGSLFRKSVIHDDSKLESPEKEIFDKYTPMLKTCTYGGGMYKKYLQKMKVALKHHYANNSHHPEFYTDGIKGMTLVDLCEMIADWKAASMRHNDGDVLKSIELNQARFNYSDELKQILINTVEEYFE